MNTRTLRQFGWFVLFLAAYCIPPSGTAQVSVTTFHYDNSRTGQNPAETLLAPGIVNLNQFGKLFTVAVDGNVYAQPLYLANVSISGVTHNVLYVATEHDSVYAIDADNGAVLAQQSFINPSAGITTVPSGDVISTDIVPEIGITSTPVIDPASGTIYVLAKTKENGSYVQRLHGLDVVTLAEKFGGPTIISANFQGRTFDALKQANRPALLLENGHVIIAWASHGDHSPYQGWVMSYGASTLAQEAVFNTELSLKGYDGGIWMSGDGVAADANGNLYFATGNGDYDGFMDFGDSIIKITGPTNGSFTIADWFTPFNQSTLNGGDTDLGSGGVLLLPDLPAGSAHQQLLVQMGKEGKIYLIDRNNMGQFCSSCASIDTNIVQEIPGASTGIYGSPAFWNNTVYWGGGKHGGSPDHVKAWSFNANGSGLLSTSPVSETSQVFSFSTAAPVISASGSSNGILWILDNSSYASSCCQILYAFDATNLGTMLYNSNQGANSRDVPGGAVKFTPPVVANGKVFVGGQGQVSAFGIFPIPFVSAPTFNPARGTYTGSVAVTLSDTTSGSTVHCTTDGSVPSVNSPVCSSVKISSNAPLQAIAVASGYNDSAVATASYTIIAANPIFSPNGKTYTSTQSITISDATVGAAIYYTTDGSTPTTASNLYSGPITVSATETLKAIAVASGCKNSGVATASYIIAASTPTFSPKAGTYTSMQSVTISDAIAGAAIYYTTDGSTPTTSSNLYSGPITVSSTQMLKAIAVASGYNNSAVASSNYTIAAAAPVFSPKAGTYTSAQSVTITDATAGAAIYYTTDGTAPTTASNSYSGPITVSSTQVLKAIAVASGYNNSAVGTGNYIIAAATPVFSPKTGTYTSAQLVTITNATAGAAIYYTTDGTTPTTASNPYSGPIAVSSTQMLKAIAVETGYNSSAVATGNYIIAAATPVFSPKTGTYTSAQSVTITDATAGAAIYYTIDGTMPTTASNPYSGAITVSSTQILKAIAVASGYNNSAVATSNYTIAAATPVFSPKAGTYTSAQAVTITDLTAGAAIYYTTDGTTPTTASNPYSGPITVASTQMLKAIAVASGYSNSAVATGNYTIP